MEKQAEVRDILAKNHMPYEVKTVNRSSGSALGGRNACGNWDMRRKNRNLCMKYVVYVKKEDYEEAASLIRK